jgi:hypothetical protein
MRRTRLLLSIIGLLCAAQAHAYGPVGHQIVGAIADERLANTPTGKKVAEMLDGFTLQKAAVIADEIKGWDRKGADDPGIFHYSARPRIDEQLRAFWHANPPTKDSKSAVPSHHWFHYTDVPVLNPEKYADGKTGRSQWDIVHMMRFCIAVLRGEEPENNARKITKPIAIILLAHYVGDIHQPLHVGAEYFDATGKPVDPDKGAPGLEDQGGNTITLPALGEKKKLHGYWDSDTVATFLPSLSGAMPKDERRITSDAAMITLVKKLSAEEPKDWRLPGSLKPNDYPEAWANEILPIAREAHERLQFQNMHSTGEEGEILASGSATEKPNKVAYRDWSAGVVQEELHKAGWRLADLLEKLLQSPNEKSTTTVSSTPPSSSVTPAPTPADAASPATELATIATITKPVNIKVPYGYSQIPVGTKLPFTNRTPTTVRLRYMGADYDVPVTSTDLQ